MEYLRSSPQRFVKKTAGNIKKSAKFISHIEPIIVEPISQTKLKAQSVVGGFLDT